MVATSLPLGALIADVIIFPFYVYVVDAASSFLIVSYYILRSEHFISLGTLMLQGLLIDPYLLANLHQFV